jgi:hypothetical protein
VLACGVENVVWVHVADLPAGDPPDPVPGRAGRPCRGALQAMLRPGRPPPGGVQGGDVLPVAGWRGRLPVMAPTMAIPRPPREGAGGRRPPEHLQVPRGAARRRPPGPELPGYRRTARAAPAIRIPSGNAFAYPALGRSPGAPQGLADPPRPSSGSRRRPRLPDRQHHQRRRPGPRPTRGGHGGRSPGRPVVLLAGPRPPAAARAPG